MKIFLLSFSLYALIPNDGFAAVATVSVVQEISVDTGSTAVWFRADASGIKTFFIANNTTPIIVDRALSILLSAHTSGKRLQITFSDSCNNNCSVSKISVLD